MRAWLIYDRVGAEKNRDYIEYHMSAGAGLGIRFELKLREELPKVFRFVNETSRPEFAIVRTRCPELSENLERAGIPVFNNSFVSRICNDKGRTIEYIEKMTIVPTIPTRVYRGERVTGELLDGCPGCVIKAVDGHGGTQVFRVEEELEIIRRGIGGADFLIQPFVKGPGRDVRVYVIGREIVGAIERTAPDGFRSNYSLGGSVKSRILTEEERALVDEITGVFSFGLVGIDFLINEKGRFILNEIEDVAGARMLFACEPDVCLLERYFSFILDNKH